MLAGIVLGSNIEKGKLYCPFFRPESNFAKLISAR
jgi:hypothetical protein